MPEAFEWIDPWKEIERAEDIQDRWRDREKYYYKDMRMAQNAAFENSYSVRRQLEHVMKLLSEQEMTKNIPPLFVRRDDLKI